MRACISNELFLVRFMFQSFSLQLVKFYRCEFLKFDSWRNWLVISFDNFMALILGSVVKFNCCQWNAILSSWLL